MLLTVDPDGTERVLLDPMAMDPSGADHARLLAALARRATCSPTRSPRAAPRSPSLRVIDVATGARRRRPDRPRAVLPRRLAARRRRRSTTCGGSTPPTCPRTRSSTTAGSGCTGSAPTRRRRPGVRRRAATAPTTTACRSAATAAGCRSRPRGHRAAQRPVGRRPVGRRRSRRRPSPRSRSASTPRPAARSAATAGSTSSPTSTPRAAGSRWPPPTALASGAWADLVPEDPRRCWTAYAILDGPELERGVLLVARGPGTRSARSPSTTWQTGRRSSARCRCPASAPSAGSSSGPRAATRRGSATPTTPPRSSVQRYDARTGDDLAVGHRRPARSRCRTSPRARSSTPRRTAPQVRMFVVFPAATTGSPPGRGRRSSTATAGSACR